ncbi:PREDICTED: snake venom metalloproteinase fibrolase-like, partial [Gekko japonicus]|uniref:Snake venom metalloproteinase fibrolase-like n=1 Tax=Gekko japonicus TaxID=146911 RepID=A0ABM1LEM1_GEKJA
FTVTFAHEQGHILGMNHDVDSCKCERESCLMAAYHSNSEKLSNCSYRDYYKFLQSGRVQCMFSPGDPDKQYELTYCGNRVVDR